MDEVPQTVGRSFAEVQLDNANATIGGLKAALREIYDGEDVHTLVGARKVAGQALIETSS